MEKTWNNKAWFMVLPVLVLVAFSAVIPLMTVVNYSVQDTFGNNQFFWNGIGWFQELLDPSSQLGERFYDSLWRNALFSALILLIEVPLGILIAYICMHALGLSSNIMSLGGIAIAIGAMVTHTKFGTGCVIDQEGEQNLGGQAFWSLGDRKSVV